MEKGLDKNKREGKGHGSAARGKRNKSKAGGSSNPYRISDSGGQNP